MERTIPGSGILKYFDMCMQFAAMLRCESITPFDIPVVPDVNSSAAISSGSIFALIYLLSPDLRSFTPSSMSPLTERTFPEPPFAEPSASVTAASAFAAAFAVPSMEIKYSIVPGFSKSGSILL